MTSREATMQLHQGDGPNSYRVRIFLAEKGIEVPMVRVGFETMEHKSPAFLKLNSLGQIPVLELADGTVITESIAICRNFEDIHPAPPLFGADPLARARVEMWNRRMEFELMATVGGVALHSSDFFKDRVPQMPAYADAMRAMAPKKWAWLDGELADGRTFVAGSDFSVADISGGVIAWIADFMQMEIPAQLTHVHAWLGRVRSRPSFDA